jgi:hypothetical protein
MEDGKLKGECFFQTILLPLNWGDGTFRRMTSRRIVPGKEIPLSRYSPTAPASGTVRGGLGLAASSFVYKSSM